MTDADGAMAFFLFLTKLLGSSWLFEALWHRQSGTSADTCQNNFRHVEFPLTSQLTFAVWVRGKKPSRVCCGLPVFGWTKFSPR